MINFNNGTLRVQGHWLKPTNGPMPLPAYTLRLRFTDGVTPSFSYGTGVQVSSSPNIWDLTYENSNWYSLLNMQTDLLEVIDAGDTSGVTNMEAMLANCVALYSVALFDTSNVTNMSYMFSACRALSNIPLFNTSKVTNMRQMLLECPITTGPAFDTSNVTDMASMFHDCTLLTSVPLYDTSNVTSMHMSFYDCESLINIPLFNTSKVTDMQQTFFRCYKVESGALALYQQASSQTTPPSNHSWTFMQCGKDTTTGAAELAQIPSNWGGTGA